MHSSIVPHSRRGTSATVQRPPTNNSSPPQALRQQPPPFTAQACPCVTTWGSVRTFAVVFAESVPNLLRTPFRRPHSARSSCPPPPALHSNRPPSFGVYHVVCPNSQESASRVPHGHFCFGGLTWPGPPFPRRDEAVVCEEGLWVSHVPCPSPRPCGLGVRSPTLREGVSCACPTNTEVGTSCGRWSRIPPALRPDPKEAPCAGGGGGGRPGQRVEEQGTWASRTQGMPCTQCEVLDVGKYSNPSFGPFSQASVEAVRFARQSTLADR